MAKKNLNKWIFALIIYLGAGIGSFIASLVPVGGGSGDFIGAGSLITLFAFPIRLFYEYSWRSYWIVILIGVILGGALTYIILKLNEK